MVDTRSGKDPGVLIQGTHIGKSRASGLDLYEPMKTILGACAGQPLLTTNDESRSQARRMNEIPLRLPGAAISGWLSGHTNLRYRPYGAMPKEGLELHAAVGVVDEHHVTGVEHALGDSE